MNTFNKMKLQSPFTSIYPRLNKYHAVQTLNQLEDFLILDTETTGIGKGSEICELAIVDYQSGDVLFNSLLQPLHLEEYSVSKARELTGISQESLIDAPCFYSVWNEVLSILKSKPITSFNTDFDLKMIRNSAQVWGIDVPPLDATCLMKLCTAWFNADYWLSLEEVADRLEIDTSQFDGVPHRASFDCCVTREVVKKMKAFL